MGGDWTLVVQEDYLGLAVVAMYRLDVFERAPDARLPDVRYAPPCDHDTVREKHAPGHVANPRHTGLVFASA